MKRPKRGDRKRRWKSACGIEGIIFLFIGAGCFIDSNGGAKVLGCIFLFMAYQAFLSRKRGWKINYKIPDRAYRMIAKGGRSAEVARAAIEATEKESKNPHRRRYAFE